MFVGVARIVLRVPSSRSLKEKRRVIRSYKERLRGKLPVSVAEVGELDLHQLATLGVAVVSVDRSRCEQVLGQAVQAARVLPDAVLSDVGTEYISFGAGGSGIHGGIEQLAHDSAWGPAIGRSATERSEFGGGGTAESHPSFDDLPWGKPSGAPHHAEPNQLDPDGAKEDEE